MMSSRASAISSSERGSSALASNFRPASRSCSPKPALHFSPASFRLLVAIDEGQNLTVAGLVQALGVSQPAVSRTLGALQRSGLVLLEGDAGDARIRRPLLTAKARRLLDGVRDRACSPRVAAAAEQLSEGVGIPRLARRDRGAQSRVPFPARIRKAAA